MTPYNSVHFVGILTPEMASLAAYTVKLGSHVTGSDDHEESSCRAGLERLGVTLFDMFAQANISKTTDLVVLSPYYDMRHTEAETAVKQKIKVLSATDYIKELAAPFRRCAVVSDYEGRLVSAWLTHVWNQGYIPLASATKTLLANGDPYVSQREADWFLLPLTGFKRDASTYEADFLSFDAEMVVLPHITYDYPELNMTLDDVYQSYYTFVKRVPRKGLIIGNSDYPRMKRLRVSLADRHIETYGFERDASWHIREVSTEGDTTHFYLAHDRQMYGPFTIPYVGEVFVSAAAAVCVASLLMDMNPTTLGKGLKTLPKLKRYFETQTDQEGRLIIDDQADHPETIRSVLEAVKAQYPEKKIWCLYQPGSFLRTKALYADLLQSLQLANSIYLADIKGYPKEKSEGLNIRHLIADLKRVHPQTYFFDETMDMTGLLRDRVATTDCIVTLGVEGICQEIVQPLIASRED